jgi:exosortase/archaeosortase family protein
MKKKKGSAQKKTENINHSRINISRFVIMYISLMVLFFFLIWFAPFRQIIDVNKIYSQVVVGILSKILGYTAIHFSYEGSLIHLPDTVLDLKFGCNGLEAIFIYSGAVLVFPAGWKKKLKGIISGFVLIQFFNILRVLALVYGALYYKSLFEYLHIYIGQGIMIALSLGIFFLYLNYANE